MQKVWKAFPTDADVGALTAEAMIDLRPWKQWTSDGQPEPGTTELLHVLECVLARSPLHPLALHLYIHAVEASPFPERADAAADRLRNLTPGLEHLVHMPSHIDVRRGRWEQAIVANENAIAAEAAYRRIVPGANIKSLLRTNRHTLVFAAIMAGQYRKAKDAVQEMLAEMPETYVLGQCALVDGFFAMPYELNLRFGRWEAMLKEPRPPEPLSHRDCTLAVRARHCIGGHQSAFRRATSQNSSCSSARNKLFLKPRSFVKRPLRRSWR